MNIFLNSAQWASLAKGAAMAACGAVLTFISQSVSGADFGPYAPVVAAVLAVLTNFIHKAATTSNDPPKSADPKEGA